MEQEGLAHQRQEARRMRLVKEVQGLVVWVLLKEPQQV
jgi:hypothetical protein